MSSLVGDFIVDVHGDPENADLQQSDAKQTPQYRVHQRYRPPPSARARAMPDDSRSDKRYFFAFASDRYGSDVHVVKPESGLMDDDAVAAEFVPIAAMPLDEMNAEAEASWVSKSRHLNERCRLQPADIDAWWSLVQLQDSIPNLTKAARLEKKIAILEVAVAANPNCDPLWLALVRYGAQAGADTDPIWARALQASPSALIVERYVRATLSSFSQFSITSLRARLQALVERLEAVAGKLHVVSLWAWVERRAGYGERATAMAQAALEFHLFCPAPLSAAPFQARLHAFEQFWESEVPRVGEPGAPTWAGWYGAGTPGAAAAAADAEPPRPPPSTLRDWFDREAACCRRMPLRGADDDDDLDLVVIFDDLRPTLFDAGDGAVIHFVDELLAALGVADDCLTRARLVPSGDDAVACRLSELDDAFDHDREAPFLRGVADGFRARLRPDDDHERRGVAALTALDQVLGSGRLAPDQRHALRLTRALIQARYLGAAAARRYVKAELKGDRANLELAAVLAQLAAPDAADSIFASLLGSMAAPWVPPVYCLAWSAVQHALDAGRDARPLLVLAADGGGRRSDGAAEIGAIALSRARNALQRLIGRLGDDAAWWRLPFGSVFGLCPGLSVALIGVHLEYAACADDLTVALAYYDAVVRPILPATGAQVQVVWSALARLVQRHARRHPASCPPRLTRALFEPALVACPLALPIWSAVIETAPNAGAVRAQFDACMGRVRRDGLYDVPIRLMLGAIVFELTQATATVAGRLHRLFEEAVAGNGRGVDLLWRLYLRFELHRGAFDAARKVLYRAVDQCPGSRDLWLDSIRALIAAAPSSGAGALKDNDLLELVTLMGEKGIRLYSQPPPI